MPAPYMSVSITVAAPPRRSFISRGPMIRHSVRAPVIATVHEHTPPVGPFLHLVERTFYDLQSENRLWLGKNYWNSHASTGGNSSRQWSLSIQRPRLARNKVVMLFQVCRTAGLDLASALNAQRSVSHSTTANVLNNMHVSTWNIPENREEATSHWTWPTTRALLDGPTFDNQRHLTQQTSMLGSLSLLRVAYQDSAARCISLENYSQISRKFFL